jgi:hypothetical protein
MLRFVVEPRLVEGCSMFTTKYSKSQPKAAGRVKKYEEGGKVENDFETIRSREGAVTMVRKGRSPQDYYGVTPNTNPPSKSKRTILERAGYEKSIADALRKHREKGPREFQLPYYEDD